MRKFLERQLYHAIPGKKCYHTPETRHRGTTLRGRRIQKSVTVYHGISAILDNVRFGRSTVIWEKQPNDVSFGCSKYGTDLIKATMYYCICIEPVNPLGTSGGSRVDIPWYIIKGDYTLDRTKQLRKPAGLDMHPKCTLAMLHTVPYTVHSKKVILPPLSIPGSQ